MKAYAEGPGLTSKIVFENVLNWQFKSDAELVNK